MHGLPKGIVHLKKPTKPKHQKKKKTTNTTPPKILVETDLIFFNKN